MKNRRTKTATIIIDELICYMQTRHMPKIIRAVATGFSHYVTQGGNYQECVSEDKDSFRQRLGCPGDYTRRNFLKIWVYCPTSKNQ